MHIFDTFGIHPRGYEWSFGSMDGEGIIVETNFLKFGQNQNFVVFHSLVQTILDSNRQSRDYTAQVGWHQLAFSFPVSLHEPDHMSILRSADFRFTVSQELLISLGLRDSVFRSASSTQGLFSSARPPQLFGERVPSEGVAWLDPKALVSAMEG
jgi:hypothetical protein